MSLTTKGVTHLEARQRPNLLEEALITLLQPVCNGWARGGSWWHLGRKRTLRVWGRAYYLNWTLSSWADGRK